MDLSEVSIMLLMDNTELKKFDCGDTDLNEFFFDKSKLYRKELLATTFILETSTDTVGYYSILTDCLRIDPSNFNSKTSLNKLLKILVPHPKRHLKNYPAIKLARLAINNKFKNQGLGKIIINYIIDYAIKLNEECSCKFITVDAYSESLQFYEKMGFKYLTIKDEGEDTRQMYLDLTPLLNTAVELE